MDTKNSYIQSGVYAGMRCGLPTIELLKKMDLSKKDKGLEIEVLARLARHPETFEAIVQEEKYIDRKYLFITALQLDIPPEKLFSVMANDMNWAIMKEYVSSYLVQYLLKYEVLPEWLEAIQKNRSAGPKDIFSIHTPDLIILLQKYPVDLLLPHINVVLDPLNTKSLGRDICAKIYTGDDVRDLIVAHVFAGYLDVFFTGYYYDNPLWLGIMSSDFQDEHNQYPLLNFLPFETSEEKIRAYIKLTRQQPNIEECTICLS